MAPPLTRAELDRRVADQRREAKEREKRAKEEQKKQRLYVLRREKQQLEAAKKQLKHTGRENAQKLNSAKYNLQQAIPAAHRQKELELASLRNQIEGNSKQLGLQKVQLEKQSESLKIARESLAQKKYYFEKNLRHWWRVGIENAKNKLRKMRENVGIYMKRAQIALAQAISGSRFGTNIQPEQFNEIQNIQKPDRQLVDQQALAVQDQGNRFQQNQINARQSEEKLLTNRNQLSHQAQKFAVEARSQIDNGRFQQQQIIEQRRLIASRQKEVDKQLREKEKEIRKENNRVIS
ncbi:MAG: hypothetical protein ABIE74_06840 [Pseudomonadota bacterium]